MQLNLPPVQSSSSAVWGRKKDPLAIFGWVQGAEPEGPWLSSPGLDCGCMRGSCLWVPAKDQSRAEPGSCCSGAQSPAQSPGAAPLQEGLYWAVPGQQPWLSCTTVTSCTCSALPLLAWMQRVLWAWAPGEAACCVLLSVHLSSVFFQGSTVLNYWIFGYYMPEDDWQLKSELVLDAV